MNWCPKDDAIIPRWVTIKNCACGPDRVPFRPLRFTMAPFYLKIGLDIGHVIAKCLSFDEFFLWFTFVRNYLCIPIYMVKRTDWLKKKNPKINGL